MTSETINPTRGAALADAFELTGLAAAIRRFGARHVEWLLANPSRLPGLISGAWAANLLDDAVAYSRPRPRRCPVRRAQQKAVTDTAVWTADQLRERLKAAQLAGDEEGAADYARRLRRHPDRFRENREEVSRG